MKSGYRLVYQTIVYVRCVDKCKQRKRRRVSLRSRIGLPSLPVYFFFLLFNFFPNSDPASYNTSKKIKRKVSSDRDSFLHLARPSLESKKKRKTHLLETLSIEMRTQPPDEYLSRSSSSSRVSPAVSPFRTREVLEDFRSNVDVSLEILVEREELASS